MPKKGSTSAETIPSIPVLWDEEEKHHKGSKSKFNVDYTFPKRDILSSVTIQCGIRWDYLAFNLNPYCLVLFMVRNTLEQLGWYSDTFLTIQIQAFPIGKGSRPT